jgi:hypothetical protein
MPIQDRGLKAMPSNGLVGAGILSMKLAELLIDQDTGWSYWQGRSTGR